ncbi:MAG: tail fiber domain-containing protein [Limisphaerales bacterium]
MKAKLHCYISMLALLAGIHQAPAQGTAFTYQGRLNSGGAPASGSYNIAFTLFGTNAGGVAIAGPVTNSTVDVTNGLFTTTVDFGNVFTGGSNWLEIAVSTNGANAFSTLAPRQQLTPVPYAEFAFSVSGLTIQQNSDGAPNVIGGASDNYVSSGTLGATIGGGGCVNDLYSSVYSNSVTATFFGTVGGGEGNKASGSDATVPGGYGNVASGSDATVGGGEGNKASDSSATVGGGEYNTASGDYATVPGGEENLASGEYSFAAGQEAQALNQGAFVWADSQNPIYSSDRNDEFKIRAGGGVQMDVSGSSGLNPAAVTINSTSANGVGLHIASSSSDAALVLGNSGTGDILKGFSGASADTLAFEVQNDGTVKSKGVVLTSDRNAKANFTSLDAQAILAKIIAMPVTEWNYKDDAVDKKHIGPMAQDFHAAFGLDGADEKHISVVDEGGVALAAIQGLNQKLEIENAKLQQQNDSLARRLDELQKTVQSLVVKK